MSRSKRPKREFHPRSHAAIYLIALLYLGYLLADLVQAYRAGGSGAPSTALLAVGVVVLGGGILVLAALAWKMSTLPPRPEKNAEQPEESEEWGEPDREEGGEGESGDSPSREERLP